MRQRLGIAGALLRDPRLLLLDEPTTGLDPAGMRDMRVLVHRLADEGITVLLSSHLMGEVEELCDRVAIVRSGRVIYEGSLRRAAASTGRRYELRTTDDERALAIAAAPARRRRRAPPTRGLAFAADETAAAALSLALARPGIGLARARAAHGHARGAVLPPDRGRRRRAAGRPRREPAEVSA